MRGVGARVGKGTLAHLPHCYAGVSTANVSECGNGYSAYPCIYEKWGFGWAIHGVADEKEGAPMSLALDQSNEPNTSQGAKPISFHGTLTATQLEAGAAYTVYRWDGVESAFDYSRGTKVAEFTASAPTWTWTDPLPIASDGATYYRCVKAQG